MQPDGGLLGGRYELTSLIATGGMGQVWRGRDTVLNRDVAVKVLRSDYTGDPTFLARFRAEAQLAAGLVHPDIATLFDYGEVPPQGRTGEHLAYLVMELVRGESLSQLLHREPRLPVARTLDILRQSAAGLAAAHAAGVVHRDVKPGNVLLSHDGRVKLTDFGIAVSAASVQLTRTGEVLGTANYLAPEQVEGKKATPASDVYALGLVGYECLAGRRGFEGETQVAVALARLRELPPPLPADVPDDVRRLIDRAIARDPAQRFADGAAFRAAIEDVLAGRPISGPTAGPRTAPLPVAAPTAATRVTGPPPAPSTRVFAAPSPDTLAEAGTGTGAEAGAARRRRWPLVLAALLGVLVIGGGTIGVLQLTGGGTDPGTGSTPSTSSSAPTSATADALVDLVASDYVGRSVNAARAELTELGMRVTVAPRQTDDVPAGQVIALDPEGQVAPGTTVTLTYAEAPPAPPPAPTPTPTPTPSPTPTEETPTEEPEETATDEGGDEGGDDDSSDNSNRDDSGQSNGQGNDNDNDNGQGNSRDDGRDDRKND